MSTIPITEVVPRISQQLTLLVYELLDAHDDTARLAAGTYGTCEVCGEPIDPARLEARPTATTCVRHAPGARRR